MILPFFPELLLESGGDANVEQNGQTVTALDQVWENSSYSHDDRVKMTQLLEKYNAGAKKHKDR